jgi:hypothetical protein
MVFLQNDEYLSNYMALHAEDGHRRGVSWTFDIYLLSVTRTRIVHFSPEAEYSKGQKGTNIFLLLLSLQVVGFSFLYEM